MKQCNTCKQWKELERFPNRRSSKDGKNSQCKQCQKEYREDNKKRISQKQKEWREDNKEYELENKKNYYQDNKKRIKENAKRHYRENKNHKKELAKQQKQSLVPYNPSTKTRKEIEKYEEIRESANGNVEIKCTYCDKWFEPTFQEIGHRINSINGKGDGDCNLYCSDECKENSSIFKKQLYPEGCKSLKFSSSSKIRQKIELYEEIRESVDGYVEAKCTYCGEWFEPARLQIRHRVDAIEGKEGLGKECRLYCSDKCKNNCPIYRQRKYPKDQKPATSREVQPQLRQLVFQRDDYTCQKCNTHKHDLEVGIHCHHIEGVRWNPIESADEDICITLCKDCHDEAHSQDGCRYHELRCVT